MDIDMSAPAVARHSIEIAAPPQAVWDVLTDIAAWPSWNSEIRSARLEGALVPGSAFTWKAGPSTITSTIQEADPPTRITWTGRTLGIKAVHVYRLEAKDGGTVVTSEESWAGPLVRLCRGMMQKQLQRSTESGLAQLKHAAEERTTASRA